MRVAIVSDIHGNRHAFEAVLDAIEASECEEMWCLGDLVGYGAEPDACVELARGTRRSAWPATTTWASAATLPLEEFSRGAALAARWTQEMITATRATTWTARAPTPTRSVGLFHASPRDPVWEYVLSPLQAELCLDVQTHRVCLIGHSHVALSFSPARRPAGHRPDARAPTRSSTSARASG